MKLQICAAGIALATATAAYAGQEAASTPAPMPAPMVVTQQSSQTVTVLPANTEIGLVMNETVTTKGKRWNEGDTFDLTVTHNVMLGNYVVIPRGSRGVGRITFLTNKGAFGKSGKMEIDLEYVEVSGRRIPLSGHYRQEGEGNTVGTVVGVVAVGVFAGFVTGKSGVIPQGRELVAHTREDLPLALSGPLPAADAVPLSVKAAGTPAYLSQAPAPAGRATTQTVASGRASASTAAPTVVNDFAAPARR